MANYIGLITVADGIVTHKLDGAYRKAASPDGVLTGCALTYSGSTLYMAAGKLIIGGRELENTSSSSWTMPTTAAYAVLKATITNDVLSISAYASASIPSSDGTQGEINQSGTTYNKILAVVSIASGAIGGIAKQIGALAAQGILYGTSATPPSGVYADGTLYVQYTE
jgi:hypothetical protein